MKQLKCLPAGIGIYVRHLSALRPQHRAAAPQIVKKDELVPAGGARRGINLNRLPARLGREQPIDRAGKGYARRHTHTHIDTHTLN